MHYCFYITLELNQIIGLMEKYEMWYSDLTSLSISEQLSGMQKCTKAPIEQIPSVNVPYQMYCSVLLPNTSILTQTK